MGRDFVSPDDVKAVAAAALAHRIVLANGVDITAGERIVGEIVGVVTAPGPSEAAKPISLSCPTETDRLRFTWHPIVVCEATTTPAFT